MRLSAGCLFLLCVSCVWAGDAARLRVLQFNVWQEGTKVEGGVDLICDAIVAARADVVCFSEVRNYKGVDWTTRVVGALGAKGHVFHGKYVAGDVGLVSRFPIEESVAVFDESKADCGSIMAWQLKLPGGRQVVVASAHLDYKHYGLNLIRGYNGSEPDWKERAEGAVTDAAAVLAYNNRSRRDEAIAAFVAKAKEWEALKLPVILCGDFNEGSHLDWTPAAKNAFGHNGVVIEWPCTKLLADAGFIDGWRALHADAVKQPGFTWPSPAKGKASTSWAPLADERDRIDFIFARGLKATGAWIVGPQQTFAKNNPADDPDKDLILPTAPWPSDHKAVLVEYE